MVKPGNPGSGWEFQGRIGKWAVILCKLPMIFSKAGIFSGNLAQKLGILGSFSGNRAFLSEFDTEIE